MVLKDYSKKVKFSVMIYIYLGKEDIKTKFRWKEMKSKEEKKQQINFTNEK